MSTFLSQARARALRPVGTLPRPRLTIVPKVAARAPRIPFVLFVVTVLSAGLVGLLLLNTSMERGAYTAGALRSESAALYQRQQDLQMRVAALQDPQRVSRRAESLGMVQNDSPAFLVLGTGKVIGSPTPGVATNSVDIALAVPGAQRNQRKVVELLAGVRNSLSTGAIAVSGHSGQQPHSTTAGDTPPASTGSGPPNGRNSPNGGPHHQAH